MFKYVMAFYCIEINVHNLLYCRTYLAAIHYNENSENSQACTKEGEARFTPVYPKKSRGERVVIKAVTEQPTYSKC